MIEEINDDQGMALEDEPIARITGNFNVDDVPPEMLTRSPVDACF